MDIPIALKLKKKVHRDIASAQDLVMEEVYRFFPRAVFHGGTAIWRCYHGNRFSEDIDMYLPSRERIGSFFEALQKRGFVILKRRVKENALYSLLEWNRVEVRFECVFSKAPVPVLKDYEMVDGNYLNVYTLPPEALLKEKIAACCSRKKARDLYDVFYLLRFLKGQRPKELAAIATLLIQDEKNLSATIISGLIPTVQEMKRYIREWES